MRIVSLKNSGFSEIDDPKEYKIWENSDSPGTELYKNKTNR
jgi:hypothetical protein